MLLFVWPSLTMDASKMSLMAFKTLSRWSAFSVKNAFDVVVVLSSSQNIKGSALRGGEGGRRQVRAVHDAPHAVAGLVLLLDRLRCT